MALADNHFALQTDGIFSRCSRLPLWSLLLACAPLFTAVAAAEAAEQFELPATLVDDQFSPPENLPSLFAHEESSAQVSSQFHIAPVAKPIDAVAQTPWKTPAFDTSTKPGLVLSQKKKLPWGLEAEWRLGIAAPSKSTGVTELTNSSLWSVQTGIGEKFYIYLHDRGTGFVRYFGNSLSVYGRILTNASDKRGAPSTLQVGAARSF